MSTNSSSFENKRLLIIVIGVVVAAGILAVVIYYASIASSAGNPVAADGGNVTSSRLKLVSVTASHTNHDLIGNVEPNQSFKVNEPVYIKTEFSNPNDNSNEHMIMSEIKSVNATTDAAAITQSDVAASGTISMELYWQPEHIGDYYLTIYALIPGELNNPAPIIPLQQIPLKVVE